MRARASRNIIWWPDGALLFAILLFAVMVRFWNLNWDWGAYNLHPDEWALNETVRRLGPDLNPHFFFYGTFPIYLDRATAQALSAVTSLDWLAQGRLALVGRTYSAVEGVLLSPVVYVIGRQLWSVGAGLLAGCCVAGAALLVQAAHFGTVDTAITLAGATLLLTSLHVASGGGVRWYVLSGIVLGLALATKLSAGPFVLLPVLAHFLRARSMATKGHRSCLAAVVRSPLTLLAVLTVAICLITAPYYLLAANELWAAIVEQNVELSGGHVFPYTWQFIGSVPYLFELQNLVLWSLGLPLGVAALAGWVWALVQAVRFRAAPMLLLTVWPTLYLLYIGTWEARFVRHTLPLMPFCCLFAAGGTFALVGWLQRKGPAADWVGRLAVGVVALGAVLWGLVVLSIYTRPDTRLAATEWLYANVPANTQLVIEDKNDLVPVPYPGHPSNSYKFATLAVTAPDTPAKMGDFASTLAEGEVLIIPNRRWSATLPKLSAFPLTGRYYRLLLDGELGYTPLRTFSSPPRLGPLSWPDNTAEETFQVFDHPTVRLFGNTGHLPADALRALLMGGGQ